MKSIVKFTIVFTTTLLILDIQSANSQNKNFVDIKTIIPSIQLDIRYYNDHNFVGKPIDGYKAPKCLLTKSAAQALLKVQQELIEKYYSLKIYDCYRPQKAVNHFVRWAKNLDDQKMKSEFYPNVDKKNLFIEGYIADKSGHSRGSTLDLTIVSISSPSHDTYLSDQQSYYKNIDMGTPYDFFDPSSHTVTNQINETQQKNRLFLKTIMEKYGFNNYSQEWWHYTLKNEPFPDKSFDFPIR